MALTCNCTYGIAPGEWREISKDQGGFYHVCPYHGKTYLSTLYPETIEMKSAFEDQEGGRHYADFVIQPIEFITKNNLNWFDGSIIKYACRHKNKGKALDLKKVIHYARLELEQEYRIKSKVEYEEEIKAV